MSDEARANQALYLGALDSGVNTLAALDDLARREQRNRFAAAALTGLLARDEWQPKHAAAEAFVQADAMTAFADAEAAHDRLTTRVKWLDARLNPPVDTLDRWTDEGVLRFVRPRYDAERTWCYWHPLTDGYVPANPQPRLYCRPKSPKEAS